MGDLLTCMCSLGGSNDQLGKLEVKSIGNSQRRLQRGWGELLAKLVHVEVQPIGSKDQGSTRDGDWHPVPSERDKEQET